MRRNQGEDPRQSPDRPPEYGAPQRAPPNAPPAGQQPPPQSEPWTRQYGPQQQPPTYQPPQQPPTQQPPTQQPPAQQAPPQQQSPPPGSPTYGPPQQQPPSQFGTQPAGPSQVGAGASAGPPPQGQSPQPATASPEAARPQLQPVTVADLVQTNVVTAEWDTPVTSVVGKLAEEDVGCVVIVEEERPVGLVTDRDIALGLEDMPDIAEREVGDLVTGELATGTVEMTVFDIVGRLEDAGVRRLPIVDDEGALEGIVTLDDILVMLESELGNVAEVIRSQSPRF